MIPITIDTMDLSSEFSLSRENVDDLLEFTVQEVTKEFARVWEAKAKQELKASRTDYINSIRVDSRGRFTGVAYLDPVTWLANAVEMGAGAFDMKEGMLSSGKAKQGKSGRYMTIPFRFATPGALGESSVFAGVMPAVIHSAVMSTEKSGGGGLPMSSIPSQFQIPKSQSLRSQLRSEGFSQLKSNTEMTSKFEGLQRSSSGSGYVTFRRVSENSEPAAFMHPGIEERDISGKAISEFSSQIPQIVDMSIDNYLVSLGF